MKRRTGLRIALVVAGVLLAHGTAHSSGVGINLPQEEEAVAGSLLRLFHVHRHTQPNTLMWRDIEWLWSDAYRAHRFTQGDSTQGMSANEKATLNRLAEAIAQTASNPFNAPYSDIRLVHDYFRHDTSMMYSPNPNHPIGFRIGGNFDDSGQVPDVDRAHVDGYLFAPGEDGMAGGLYPSAFMTAKEDSSTGNWVSDEDYSTRDRNALMYQGPPVSSPLDLNGTGWTRPDGPYNAYIMHEFQHAVDMKGGHSITEILSSGAEALAGHEVNPISVDTPYTWPLTSLTSPSESSVWTSGKNYQAFRLFSAYLLYNYRGLDTRPLLPTAS